MDKEYLEKKEVQFNKITEWLDGLDQDYLFKICEDFLKGYLVVKFLTEPLVYEVRRTEHIKEKNKFYTYTACFDIIRNDVIYSYKVTLDYFGIKIEEWSDSKYQNPVLVGWQMFKHMSSIEWTGRTSKLINALRYMD